MGRCHGHAESDVRTKKNKEVCAAQVDRSGESFRVPGGLATEERGLRKYKLYRQACNTWNANDQSSRAKIVLLPEAIRFRRPGVPKAVKASNPEEVFLVIG